VARLHETNHVHRRSRAVTATTAVTACSDGGATDSDQPSSEPIVADTSNDDPSSASTTSVQSQADRIVSLSPSATEMLFAMGAGDQSWESTINRTTRLTH
jgi:iron complex transport system substrate-binding protein